MMGDVAELLPIAPSRQIMAMPVTLRRFTVDEVDAFPDDGNRYELLDGFLLVTPGPGLPHQSVATELAVLLATFLREEPDIRVWAPGVLIDRPDLELQPDVLVGRLPPGGERWEQVREHWLAIEVSGRSSRVYDREYKRDAYLALGVQEVWLVDLDLKRGFVSRLGAERDEPLDSVLTWRPPAWTRELRLDVAALFRRAASQ
jgi:Uma2 family endonuclease